MMAMVYHLDDKGAIKIPKQYPWRVGGSVDGLDFKLLYKQVGHKGADGGPHCCSLYLFKIAIFEKKICVFKEELQQCSYM